jgi:hypothetical protein
MPLDYKDYHPKWSLISRLVRYRRAKNICEWCGVQNGEVVKRLNGGAFRKLSSVEWDMVNCRIKYSNSNMSESLKHHGFSKIVLTVAHVDHDKTNNDFKNLAALCQRCHLKHDIKQHGDNRKYGRNWKGKHQTRLF